MTDSSRARPADGECQKAFPPPDPAPPPGSRPPGEAEAALCAMPWDLQYTPAMWPGLTCFVFVVVLSAMVWRQRAIAGAPELAQMLFLSSLWALCNALVVASVTEAAGLFWSKLSYIWLFPMAASRLAFVLEYSGPGRWLTRPVMAFLALFSFVPPAFIVTNDLHHLFWVTLSSEGLASTITGPVGWAFATLAYLLTVVGLILLVRLYIRSPRYRLPVAMVVLAQVVSHATFAVDNFTADLPVSFDLTLLAGMISASLYALALLRYRMFDPIPIARETVIEQMDEGMLVVDLQQCVVDLNRAAEAMLGLPRARALGSSSDAVLGGSGGLGRDLTHPGNGLQEVTLGSGKAVRDYELHLSPLQDPRGSPVGTLVLMHDVTERKRAQAQIVQQQRLVATLNERQQLARELHDGVAQVLSYVGLQARAIHKLVGDGNLAAAQAQSLRLASAAEEAHADVRASIGELKLAAAPDWSLLSALRQHVDTFTAQTGIVSELIIAPVLEQDAFSPDAGPQLLRVIQEAMTNVRKHSGATRVEVALHCEDDGARVTVADNGRGFDPAENVASPGTHLGLTTMRERMTQIGGTLEIRSQTGAGAQVILRVPMRARALGKTS